MTDPAPTCATPGCPFTPTTVSPFCGACLKMHAIMAAQRSGEALRKKAHDLADRGITAALDWLFKPRA